MTILDATAETMIGAGTGYQKDVDVIEKEAKAKKVAFYQPDKQLVDSIDKYKKNIHEYAAMTGEKQFNLKDAPELIARFEAIARKWQKLLDGVDRKDEAKLLSLLRREVYDKVDPAKYGMQ